MPQNKQQTAKKKPYRTYHFSQEQIDSNKWILEEHFDPVFGRKMAEELMTFVSECYFRPKLVGFDELPPQQEGRPLIYASNHSGMAFPWDGIIFATQIMKQNNYSYKRSLRVLATPLLSKVKVMSPFLIENLWKRCGGIDASALNYDTVMQQNESDILVYPEGVHGIGKGFNKKYQLQRLETSTLRMAIKYKTDIIPVAGINGEYINPYTYSIPRVNKFVQDNLGLPFLPVGLSTLMILFQPWVFYMALPAKLTYVRGETIRPYELTDKPYEEMTREDFHRIRDGIREKMQHRLNKHKWDHGQNPFEWKEMLSTFWKHKSSFPWFMPFGWPVLFLEFERLMKKHPDGEFSMKLKFFHFFIALLRNPLSICYYLPLIGWLPILFVGHRMVKKTERR